MRRHYDANGVKNLLYACSLVRRLTIIEVFPDPALPMNAMKNRQFGKGASHCLWIGLSHRNLGALSWSLLDISIRNILVLSL